MDREGKLLKNTFIISIGTFLPKLASFITLPVLTGCLSKEEYGNYDLITVLVSFVLPIATLQIQAAAFRYLIEVRDNKKEICRIITSISFFIGLTSFIALSILFFLIPYQSVPLKLLICLYFLVDIIVNATRQICRGLDKNLDYSISAIVSSLGKMMFAVVFVYILKKGLLGSIIALCAASMASLAFLLYKTRIYTYISSKGFDKSILKEMLRYSWPMVPNSMSAWIMRVSDRFVITLFMGVAANAVYSVANKIPSLLNIAQNTFTMAWQENASIVSKDKDASQYYSKMFSKIYGFMAGLFGLLIAMTPLLFKMLVRGDYSRAYPQMPILFLAMFFYGMSTFLGGIYVAYKKSKSVGITTTIAAMINLVTDLCAIRWAGLYAASGSTLVAYVFLFVYRILDVQKIIRIHIDYKRSILILVFVLFECALCFMNIPLLNILNIVLSLLVFSLLNKNVIQVVYHKAKRFLAKGKRIKHGNGG